MENDLLVQWICLKNNNVPIVIQTGGSMCSLIAFFNFLSMDKCGMILQLWDKHNLIFSCGTISIILLHEILIDCAINYFGLPKEQENKMHQSLETAQNALPISPVLNAANCFENELSVFLTHALKIPLYHLLFVPKFSSFSEKYSGTVPVEIDIVRNLSYEDILPCTSQKKKGFGILESASEGEISAAKWIKSHISSKNEKTPWGVDELLKLVLPEQVFVLYYTGHYSVCLKHDEKIFEMESMFDPVIAPGNFYCFSPFVDKSIMFTASQLISIAENSLPLPILSPAFAPRGETSSSHISSLSSSSSSSLVVPSSLSAICSITAAGKTVDCSTSRSEAVSMGNSNIGCSCIQKESEEDANSGLVSEKSHYETVNDILRDIIAEYKQ